MAQPRKRKAAGPSAVYVIVDSPDQRRAIQPGQPPTQLAAYRLDVDAGADSNQVVTDWIGAQNFPPSSLFGVVDETSVAPLLLRPTLEPGTIMPGCDPTS